MPYKIESDDVQLTAARRVLAKARALYPAAWTCAGFIARMARRAAPVGKWAGRGALKKSLNAVATSHNTIVLQSPLAYAKIQQEGGTVTAGQGPLGSKLLAIPLNADAARMLNSMRAGLSLKTQDLIFIRSRRGRMFLIRQNKIGSGQRRRKGGKARRHRMFDGQIMFMLVPRVSIPPQPYAPRMDDPELRVFVAKTLSGHLKAEE